jgi:hypothetical protein
MLEWSKVKTKLTPERKIKETTWNKRLSVRLTLSLESENDKELNELRKLWTELDAATDRSSAVLSILNKYKSWTQRDSTDITVNQKSDKVNTFANIGKSDSGESWATSLLNGLASVKDFPALASFTAICKGWGATGLTGPQGEQGPRYRRQ